MVASRDPRTKITAAMQSPSIIAVTRLIVQLSPLITAPVIARELGPSGRGLYAACFAATILAPVVLGMGLPLAVRRRASIGAPESTIRAVYVVLPFLVPAAVVIGLLIERLVITELDPVGTRAFLLGMGCSVGFIATLCFQSVLIAGQRYGAIALLQSTQPVALTCGVALGWILGSLTLPWVLVSAAASTLLSTLVGVCLTRISPRGPRSRLRPLARESVVYSGSQAAETASNTLPQIVAVVAIGAHDAGLFAIAITVASLPMTLGHTIASVMFRDAAASASEASKRISALSIRITALTVAVPVVVLGCTTPVLIPLIFGEGFRGSIAMTLICLCGSVFLTVNYVASQMLVAQGRGGLMTAAQLLGLGVGVALMFILGPHLGGAGAALASVAGWMVTTLSSLRALRLSPTSLLFRAGDLRRCFNVVAKGHIDYSAV
ncbi:lipopolysaccharide biosynthesis protein [Rhodococcus sp. NPDC056960]|uniref:lipopolysaccharide biosynthesis protein n=1 Tax=Rhodococcus sp. NPDC056960 TaxID=3345982 RepID=UPI0036405226